MIVGCDGTGVRNTYHDIAVGGGRGGMGVCSITAAFAEFVADGHGAYGQLVEGDVFDVVLPAEKEMVGGGVVEAVAVED